jgi:hypothetical protein
VACRAGDPDEAQLETAGQLSKNFVKTVDCDSYSSSCGLMAISFRNRLLHIRDQWFKIFKTWQPTKNECKHFGYQSNTSGTFFPR